jgi:hypothetical protein
VPSSTGLSIPRRAIVFKEAMMIPVLSPTMQSGQFTCHNQCFFSGGTQGYANP